MSKVFKLAIFVLVLVGLSCFMSGNKVYATQTGCPGGDVVPQNWGIQTPGEHNFASVAVHAYYSDNFDNFHGLDIKYHLRSSADHDHGQNYGPPPPGVPNNLYPDARIFQEPIPGGGRTDARWFHTGGTLYAAPQPPVNNGDGCQGWDELGPGTEARIGNTFVLDCQEFDTNHNLWSNHFWIDQITNPDGAIGKYGGHWKIYVSTAGEALRYKGTSMSYDNDLEVENGENARINLEWIPNPPPPPTNSDSCSKIDWYNYGNYQTTNKHGDTVPHITRTLVYTVNPGAIDTGTGGTIFAYAPFKEGTLEKRDKVWHIRATAGSFTFYTIREFQETNGDWAFINDDGSANFTSYTPTGDPNADAQHVNVDAHTIANCYHAACGNVAGQSVSIDSGRSDNLVLTNSTFTVTVPVQNDGTNPPYPNGETIPQSPGGYDFSLTEPPPNSAGNTFVKHAVGGYLNVGDWTTVTMTFTAPSTVQNMNLTFYPDLYGSGALGGSCSVTVPVYQHFTLEPHVDLSPKGTAENLPGNKITYDTGVINHSNSSISAPSTSSFTVTPYSGGAPCSSVPPVNSNGPYGPNGTTYTIPSSTCSPTSVNAGDQYCAEVDLTYNTGYVGPGGDIQSPGVDPNTPLQDKGCLTIINEPYFKALGGGISARSGLTPASAACPANATNSGLLAGWNNNTGGSDRGAGSQLSALALIKITGVASAQTVATRSPTDLTFANNNPADISSDSDSPSLGGNFGGSPNCGAAPIIKATSTIGGTSGVPASPGSYKTAGNLKLTGGTVSSSGATSIKVNGDVYITGPITYGANPTWTNNGGSLSGPSFVLEATGNIYIAPGVTQLDGMYYAQPKDATTGGTIYTCAPSSAPPAATYDFYGNCGSQLLVNGAFVANNIKLERTFGSLRDGGPGCSNDGGRSAGSPSGICAGEIFRFSPEIYLQVPAFQSNSNGAAQYDSITSLPPVL